MNHGLPERFVLTIGLLAAMGGTYSFVRTASANLREQDDVYNTALGGFFSGALLGLRGEPSYLGSKMINWGRHGRARRTDTLAVRTIPAVLGYGVALSTAMAAFEYTGGTLFGYKKDHTEDEFERRQKLRKAFRTPAEETISELGEGRGT